MANKIKLYSSNPQDPKLLAEAKRLAIATGKKVVCKLLGKAPCFKLKE